MSTGRVRAAIRKEFRQFFRDPVLLILVLWLYTIEVVLCSVSLSFDLKEESMAVLDLDRSVASRELGESLDRSTSFAVRFRPGTREEAGRLLSSGRATLVVAIERGFGEDLARRGNPTVQVLADGTNSMVAMTALGVVRRLVATFSFDYLDDNRVGASTVATGISPPGGVMGRVDGLRSATVVGMPRGPRLENRLRLWYNPGLRFVYFMVISMIALAGYMVGVIHPAASIVKEKESGTLEQVLVSPLGPTELIFAKTFPTFVIGLLALGPGMLIARAFGVPFRGDLLSFFLLSAAFLIGAIATGVLIASAVRSLQQALLVSFFVLFPVMFISGTMTPIESMPEGLQWLSRLSPLRYYMDALLGVFLKGVGLRTLWSDFAWMLGLGVVSFAGAAAFFRRRLV